MNQELKIKNTITYLHNNLEAGQGYSINGNLYLYTGFGPVVKGGISVHKFLREGRSLNLDREDLIVLDLFNEIEL